MKIHAKVWGAIGLIRKQELLESSTFSSYYSHHICTLEGGLTCFRDSSDLTIAESVRSHGWLRHLDKDDDIFKKYSMLDPKFIFNYIGYNLRLSEPQAAIGLEQIKQLDRFYLEELNQQKFTLLSLKIIKI